jgi:Flp pilus assembly protein TadG
MTHSLLPLSKLRRLGGADAGAAAVEFAIVLPVFLLMLLGIFDFARACWVANSLQFAVAQGARYVTLSPTSSSRATAANCTTWVSSGGSATYTTSITTYVRTQLTNWGVSTATPTVTASVSCTGSPPTVTVTVSASYTFGFMFNTLETLIPGGIAMGQRAVVTTPLS